MNRPDLPPPLLPDARIVQPKRFRLSWIWLVPLLAVLVGLGLGIQALLAKGPEITLRFALADGLEANKTRVKFKDVEIGTVRHIRLDDDRQAVQVTVQMDKQAEGLLVEDSRFWVVRPRVAAGSVSGLTTLFSGAYIAIDPGKSANPRRSFKGLEEPPLVTSDTPGRQFILATDSLGSLDIGSPVYFRRIPVGRVVGYALRPDGKGVEVRIFVNAPHDAFVQTASRFWHASGLDISLDANGARLDMQSLVSLALGGIAFASPGLDNETANSKPAAENRRFTLHPDQNTALQRPDSVVEKYMLVFHESVRGLTIGAPVDFRGLTAGEVARIDLHSAPGRNDFSMQVEIRLYPERFNHWLREAAVADDNPHPSRPVLDKLVAKGFRAQLRTGNIVSGQRYVALDFFPQAKAARIDWHDRLPNLPTQPGILDSVQGQLLTIVETLRHTLKHVDQLVIQLDRNIAPELAGTLRDARKTLDKADRVLGSADKTLASDAPLQIEMRDTLREVNRAATAVRNLADVLERQPNALLTGKKGE